MQSIFKFTHVAAPVMRQQPLDRQLADWAQRHVVGFGILFDKEFGQNRNIVRAFAQRRNIEVNDIQTEIKVFSEVACVDFGLKITVRGCQNTHIDFNRAFAAKPINFLFLNGTQQFCLQADVHFADFIKQKGSVVGFFEFTDPPRLRAGKGAFFMAEQFGFQKIIGDGCTVYRDKRFVRAV